MNFPKKKYIYIYLPQQLSKLINFVTMLFTYLYNIGIYIYINISKEKKETAGRETTRDTTPSLPLKKTKRDREGLRKIRSEANLGRRGGGRGNGNETVEKCRIR